MCDVLLDLLGNLPLWITTKSQEYFVIDSLYILHVVLSSRSYEGIVLPNPGKQHSRLGLNPDKCSILKKSLFCLFDYRSRRALALVSCHLHLIKAMTLADPTDPYLSEGAKSETLIVVERAAPAVFQ